MTKIVIFSETLPRQADRQKQRSTLRQVAQIKVSHGNLRHRESRNGYKFGFPLFFRSEKQGISSFSNEHSKATVNRWLALAC